MDAIDGKDVALLLVVGYVAVMVLVRLMLGYRDRLIVRFRDEMRQAKRARARAEAKAQADAKAAATPQRNAA
jgi:hypothetical protein